MRLAQAVLTALALGLTALPANALDPCGTSTATLTGGFTMPYPGMGDYVYKQEMRLEHKGAGMAGLWVGTYHAQHNTYPFVLDDLTRAAAMAGTSAIAAVEAVCVPDLPDANTITVACTGRFPFTFHANGTITWEGMSQVIGEYTKTLITIDMQRGAPGYAALKQKRGEMGGAPILAGNMNLLFDITDNGKIAGSAAPAYSYTIKGRAEPTGASVVVFATTTGVAGGPIVSTPASPDTVEVILRHASETGRMKQADTIKLEIQADWGKDCTASHITTVFDAMLADGPKP